jgi:hypothetical protein
MPDSIQHTLRHVVDGSFKHADAETLERVGRCIAAFIEAEKKGDPAAHPEASIVELPVLDHEVARRCFDMLFLLQNLGSVKQ